MSDSLDKLDEFAKLVLAYRPKKKRDNMQNKSLNRSLHAAKATKQDEFYTQLSDIDDELKHYTKYFKGKTVLCNCDDPKVSNFFHYFSHNFEKLQLKKLIATCYKNCDADLFSKHTDERGIYLEYEGDKSGNRVPDPDEIGIHKLKGDGDFRSEECVKLLKQADVVVTNPPFSLFREYVEQLVKYKKKFLIIGNTNALTYKDTFRLIMEDKLRTGYTNFNVGMFFAVPDDWEQFHHVDKDGRKIVRVATSCWFTNLDVAKHKESLPLYKEYTPEEFPKYDNYDAIEVSRYKDIPADYDGPMGVPITFLDKYNPNQFEIVGVTQSWFDGRIKTYPQQTQVGADGHRSNVTKLNDGAALKSDSIPQNTTYYIVNGEYYVKVYARILIRRKTP
jgi:hypothetical protein